ncbi:MAG: YtxH domain-containing protein [Elusimicrobia bacterium]|nr:YtxH domain-containing protein [Elusimicrobiota bacterium]
MSDNTSSPSLAAFLVGAALGAAAALLLAPRSGRDTRRRLARWLEEWEDETKDLLAEGGELPPRTGRQSPPPRQGRRPGRGQRVRGRAP